MTLNTKDSYKERKVTIKRERGVGRERDREKEGVRE